MMREIELKAHAANALELKQRIESLYGEGRDVAKSDVYFHLPGEVKQALRMRNNRGVLEFTAKKTSSDDLSEDNKEYEFTCDINERDRAFDFFCCLGYEPYFRKNKNGWEWTVGDVHVELLEVSGFRYGFENEMKSHGYFLEMEILIPFRQTSVDPREEQNKLYNLLHRFGLRDEDVERGSYRSMILGE